MSGLYLAPMEEITGYVFRNALNRHFGGVDKYFTPFISCDNRIMKTRSSRELLPSNNEGLKVVPQLMTNDKDQFNEAAKLIASLGYKEININFGCPSNTVASKFKGSGILRAPEIMERFLDGIFNGRGSVLEDNPRLRISVKTRLGYNATSDFENVINILNAYPLCEVIVHPRLKKDLYNGKPRMEMFDMACDRLNADIVYNGDVFSVQDHNDIICRYSDAQACSHAPVAVMIGRGAVRYPGIFRMIRTGRNMTADELYSFLNDLFDTYKADCGPGPAVAKMKEVWSYTCGLIEDEDDRRRVHKNIIKAKDENAYRDAVSVAKRSFRL